MTSKSELLFGPQSPEEKIHAFSISTAKQLLSEFGVPTAYQKQLARDNGELLTHTVATLLGFDRPVYATRVFSFSFEDLFTRREPHKKVIEAFKAAPVHGPEDTDRYDVVIKSFAVGRLVITSVPEVPDEDMPVLRINTKQVGHPLYVHHFKSFFRRLYPDVEGID